MRLDANNNGRIIYRIARSNLTGSKVYTLFSGLTIILSITFIIVMTLFLQGTQTAEEQWIDSIYVYGESRIDIIYKEKINKSKKSIKNC